MRVTKLLALAMIYLIISLTFSSALVFATIYKAEMMGQDQAPGAIRPTDNVVVRAEATMPCSVAGDFLNFSNYTFAQMSCSTGTPTSCSYTKQVKNVTGKLTATVKEAASGLTQQVEAYVDTKPPAIVSLTTISLGNMAKASYVLKDEGNDYYPGKCSGFRKVEFLINNKVVNSTNYTAGECSITGALTGTVANYVGKVNTSIKAYDYVGYSVNQSGGEVFIDTKPPTIKTGAKAYKPGTTEEIKKISTNSTRTVMGDILIIIEDEAIASSGGVFGDFTELDKTKSVDQSNVGASCTRPGWNQTHECLFSGIKISPASASPKFKVAATDEMGNTASQNLTISFTVVNNAGTVTRLGPDPSHCYQEVCYLKSGKNELIALISTSSSYNNSEVKIEGQQATCYYNSTWTCKAEASVSGDKINLEGYDDLGNYISAESTLNIVVDSTPPKKTGDVNVTPICPTSKESLRIMFNVSEEMSPSLKLSANTQSISTNNLTMTNCTKIGTTTNWQCALSISNLLEQEINTNLQVIVEDLAGNQLVLGVPVSICILLDEVPDLIKEIKTRGALPRIDRKTASKLPSGIKAPIGLEIVLKQENVEIISRTLVSCTGTPCLSSSAYMIDDTTLKPTLIVPLKYAKACGELWDDDDKIEINCTQEFSIKQGNRIYNQKEKETIAAELEVYNQPLGSVNETYTKKIDEIKKEIIRLDGQIEKYEKVYGLLGGLCNIAEGLAKINILLQSLKSALWGVCVALDVIGVGEAIWNAINPILSGFENFVDSFTWPQGWVPTGGNSIGLLIKGTCAIYTCKIYDFNTYVDIGLSIAAHYATKNDIKIIGKTEDSFCPPGGLPCIEGDFYFYEDGSVQAGLPDGSRGFYDASTGLTTVKFSSGYVGVYKSDGSYTIKDQYGNTALTSHAGESAPTETASLPDDVKKYSPGFSAYTSKDTIKSSFPFSWYPRRPPEGVVSIDEVLVVGYTDPKVRFTEPIKLIEGDAIASDSITGYAIKLPSFKNNLLKGFQLYGKDINAFRLDTRMQTALDAFLGEDGNWIFNPYKSKHYDKFCAPAIMFNDKKERQLLCKRLGCLEAMAKVGGPLEACEFDYNLDMCMYVESARYKLEGGASIGRVFDSVKDVFLNNVVGLGVVATYLFVYPGCVHYQTPGGLTLDYGGTLKGSRAAACGVIGSVLSLREILAFASNPYNPLSGKKMVPTDLPATSTDFCKGLDLDE